MKRVHSLALIGLLGLAGCDLDKINLTNLQTIDFAPAIPRSLKSHHFQRVDSFRHQPTYTNNDDAQCIPGPDCE